MITKYTDSAKTEYKDLYKKIGEASNGAIQIDNLESFFGNIEEIAKLDTKFLRLPLDEPLFEINANSRKISIPSDFAANGLSVQGDHLAETVYFCIDRYFDYMDLNNCKIRINWKMGDAFGQSVNFSKSLDAEPGKIIFGWPVAKEMTGKSGSLSFAVEFYVEDQDGNSSYSLNTLVSTITIKEGLVLIEPAVINVGDNILNMLQNSEFGEGEAKVEDLKWLTGGLVANPDDITALTSINLMGNVNSNLGAIELNSTPVTLYARAEAGDADIKYSSIVPIGAAEAKDKYVLVSKTDDNNKRIPLDEKGTYYVKSGENAYVEADLEDIKTWNSEEVLTPTVKEFYARYSALIVDRVGEYVMRAQGVKFDDKNKKIGQGSVESTGIVVCPNPEIPGNIHITIEDITLGDGYSIENGSVENIAFLMGVDPVKMDINSDGYDNKDAYAPIEGTPKALIQYSIYKNDSEEAITQSDWVRSNESFKFNAADEGDYVVGVKSFLNGKVTDDESKSNPFKVSHLASKFKTISIELKNNRIDLAESIDGVLSKNGSSTFNIIYDFDAETSYSDSVTVSLFYQNDDDTTSEIGAPTKVVDIEGGKAITITSALIQNVEGNYFLSLANKYNGSIYTQKTDSFYINIK